MQQRLGSYELIRRLGEGGMAQVYLARDVRLGREVAVKVLDQHLAERAGFRERFLREARVAAALDHPNIVPLYDFGESGLLYLVMPYVSGGSLQDIVRRAPLPLSEVVTYGTQIADALEYAHQRNVVHRDVKPANMLLHADGRLMLSDFGLAKILGPVPRPAAPTGHPDAGTPEYMAPEQIEGRTDSRSDIYALGVVLYLLLTGRLPFTGSSSNQVMEGHLYCVAAQPRTLNPAVTPAMQAVVMHALAKHPDERYQRAHEMGAALVSALIAGDAEPLPFSFGGAESTNSLPSMPSSMPPRPDSWRGSGWDASGVSSGLDQPGVMANVPRHLGAAYGTQSSTQAHRPSGSYSPAGPISTSGRVPVIAQSMPAGPSGVTLGGPFDSGPLPMNAPPTAPSAQPLVPASVPSQASLVSVPLPVPPVPRSVPKEYGDSGRHVWVLVAVLLLLALMVAGVLLHWLLVHPATLPGDHSLSSMLARAMSIRRPLSTDHSILVVASHAGQ